MFSNVLVLLALRLARFEKKTRVRKDPIDVPSPSPPRIEWKRKTLSSINKNENFLSFYARIERIKRTFKYFKRDKKAAQTSKVVKRIAFLTHKTCRRKKNSAEIN